MADEEAVALTMTASQIAQIKADVVAILANQQAAKIASDANWAKLFGEVGIFMASVDACFVQIRSQLDRIEQEVNPPDIDITPARVRVVGPTVRDFYTGKILNMPQSVLNDVITNFPVEFDNLAGQVASAPAGGTVTVSLVDPTGAPSPLGTAALGADGVSFDVFPSLPIGSSLGNATVKFDDMVNIGTPNDISFTYDITFGNDPNAASAHVDSTKITTRPFPPAPTGATGP